MDHLPQIEDAAFPADEIRCSPESTVLYTGSDLVTFPEQRGLRYCQGKGKYSASNYALDTSQPLWTSYTEEHKQAFVIAWLFFGPLTDISTTIYRSLSTSAFSYLKDGTTILHLGSIEAFASGWQDQEAALDQHYKAWRRQRIHDIIEMAVLFSDGNLGRWNLGQQICSLSSECTSLISMLHESLRFAWGRIYESEGLARLTGSGISSHLSDERMRMADWCPSEISILKQRFTLTGRYFASRLKRRRTKMDHRLCTDTKCYATQIDETIYVTKHWIQNCECDHTFVDSETVANILKTGGIPRFHFEPQSDDENPMRIRIVDSGPYTAISHVWAHGLGNAQANSLPQCQIKRLYEHAFSLRSKLTGNSEGGNVAIWIDTLGVPLERSARKLALRALQRTYEQCDSCLVLDEELEASSANCSVEESCIRLAMSAWSRRLWTFQEGFLTADRLYIQFADGPRKYEELWNKDRSLLAVPLLSDCTTEAKRNMPVGEDVESSERELIASITEACRYRTTSRLSDETFCFASIAGLDTRAILEVPTHEERMKAFLLQLYTIPAEIIFHNGPRLNVNNFRWAPRSFLYPEPSSNIFAALGDGDEQLARCSPSGLQGKWPGFLLKFPTTATPSNRAFYFKFREYWIVLNPLSPVKRVLRNATIDVEERNIWQQIHTMKSPGLLIGEIRQFQDLGLIVSVEKTTSNMVTATCILKISANLVPESEPDVFDPDETDSQKAHRIEGDQVDGGMMWNLM